VNAYFFGMCVAMAAYVSVGLLVSRKVKDANDFYVAGRRAPTLLIAGSIIASYASTGLFLGDAAQCYDGLFGPLALHACMQAAGYLVGAVFFGRYLRRSRVMTIPQFFGKRFCSRPLRLLSAVTAVITMTVYLLSVMQGIGTLMHVVTNVNYNLCVTMAVIVFTILTVTSGSHGVLITDTIMAGVFTVAQIVTVFVISNKAGGWFAAVRTIGADLSLSGLLSCGGVPGVLYHTGWENLTWCMINTVVWTSVCMVGPWQSSRYLMAKDEHAVIRSAPISAIGIFLVEFMVSITAVILHLFQPEVESSSHVMIWAAMNILPMALGVVFLVGVLSAGISSATTFLSLIAASVANDIVLTGREETPENSAKSVRIGRVVMVAVSAVVLACAVLNPPSIYWIMLLGGSIAACSWMPVAVASIFSKRVTRTGAFCGMLCGFLGCFTAKLYGTFAGIILPVYLDPGLIGILCNLAALVAGSALTRVTPEEKAAREALFVMPESEKVPSEICKTKAWAKVAVLVGPLAAAVLLLFWVLPYYQGLAMQA